MKFEKNISQRYIILFLLFILAFYPQPIINNIVVIRLFDVLLLTALIAYAINIVFFSGKLKIVKSKVYFQYLLFLLWILFSFLWGTQLNIAIKNFLQYVELFLFIFVVVSIGRKINIYEILKILYTSVALLTICFVGYHFFNGNFIRLKSIGKQLPGFATALTFNYFLFTRKKIKIGILLLLFALFAVLTLERKSWVAFSFSAIIQLITYNIFVIKKTKLFKINESNLAIICIFLIIVIIGGVLFNYNSLVRKQVLSLISIFQENPNFQTASNRSRLNQLKVMSRIVKESPVLGIGIENFKEKYRSLTNLSKIHGMHNEFLTILIGLGSIGLLLFISLWMYPFLGVISELKKIGTNMDFNYKQSGIFILGIWSYGFVFTMFRATGLLNMVFLVLPISLFMLYKLELACKLEG